MKRLLQTHYQIDDFQDNYFVIDSFDQLFNDTYADFTPIYAALKDKPEFKAGTLGADDTVITHGTGVYAAEAEQRRKARKAQG